MDNFLNPAGSLSVILRIFSVLLCTGVAVMVFRMRGDFIRRFGNSSSERKNGARLRYITLLTAPLLMAGISLVSLLHECLYGSSLHMDFITFLGTAIPAAAVLAAVYSGLTIFREKQGRDRAGMRRDCAFRLTVPDASVSIFRTPENPEPFSVYENSQKKN